MINSVSAGSNAFASKQATSTNSNQAASSNRSFEQIIEDYWSDEQRGSAYDYLSSLNGAELQAVGREHNFADPTPKLDGISIEGANNLLRFKGETIDENHDGIDQIGESRIWRFPNSNTPDDVKAAWEDATAGMDEGEKMLMSGVLFMPMPQVEIDDATGQVTRVIHPGEEGYVNRQGRADYSYARELESKLLALDDPRTPPVNIEFYQKAKAFYQRLQESFEKFDIA